MKPFYLSADFPIFLLCLKTLRMCLAFIAMFDSFQYKQCCCSIQSACPSMFRLVTLRSWRHACGRSAEAAPCSILSQLLQSSTFTQTASKATSTIYTFTQLLPLARQLHCCTASAARTATTMCYIHLSAVYVTYYISPPLHFPAMAKQCF